MNVNTILDFYVDFEILLLAEFIVKKEEMMQNLKISVYNSKARKKPAASESKPGESGKPEKEIVLPLSTLHIGLRFLPKAIKASLEKEGIDLSGSRDLTKEKGLKGTLIEVENSNECIVISLE